MEPINETEMRIWKLLQKAPDQWRTHADMQRQLSGYGERVVRARAKRLADLGVLERAYLGAVHYRVSQAPSEEARRHIEALEFGATVVSSKKQTSR